jgi:uncharacterized membrane protein
VTVARDGPVAVIAAAGLAVSAYLTAVKLAGSTALLCETGSGCDVVQASRYALFLGIPTAAWGVALYALVVGLALAGLTAGRWLAAFVLGVVAVAFSAYLAWLQLLVLRAICPWCVLDAAIAVVLLAALLWRRPEARGRRSPIRAGRLAWLGPAVFVATLAAGIGVHVAEPPSAAPGYREALARHLTATGAVFYGAHW